jgi:hypothetical protein
MNPHSSWYTENLNTNILCLNRFQAGQPGKFESDFLPEQEIFSCFISFRPALGPTQPPPQRVTEAPTGVKRLEREVQHSPPSTSDIKHAWNTTPLLHTSPSLGTETDLPSPYPVSSRWHSSVSAGREKYAGCHVLKTCCQDYKGRFRKHRRLYKTYMCLLWAYSRKVK